MKKTLTLLAVAVMAASALTGCSQPQPTAPAAPVAPGGAPAAPGGAPAAPGAPGNPAASQPGVDPAQQQVIDRESRGG